MLNGSTRVNTPVTAQKENQNETGRADAAANPATRRQYRPSGGYLRTGQSPQVSRALKVLLDRGKLVRIGTGISAKARRFSITGAVIPADSLETLTAEALERLGVQLQPGEASKDYNAGTVAVTGVCAFLHATTNSLR